jgi:nitrogen fixation protein NifX
MRRLQLIDVEEADPATEIPGGLKIAFATQDMRRVDAHFGSARVIMIYEVGPGGHRFIEAVEFEDVCSEDGDHGESEDRIGAKVEALNGCAMLFVLAIGGGAAARVVNSRVYPVKVPVPESIADVILRIQTMLRGSPPPWLRKLMAAPSSDKLDFIGE